MIGNTIRVGLVLVAVMGAGLVVACGSDEPAAAKTPSFEDLSAKLDAPTGTLDKTSAAPVAVEFGKISSSGLGGTRQVQATQDVSAQVCTSGGTAQANASGSGSAGNVSIVYSNCCMQQSCCVNGTVDTVYNASGSTTAKYSYCLNEDVSATCDGVTMTLKAAGCLGSSGEFVYSIDVAGKTYSVSGSYSGGNGTLTISGANGTFTCTYTNNTGTCTGTSGEFSF